MPNTQIPGFGASNRVPMVAGNVQTGVGGQSAANLAKKLLLVGLMSSSGTLTPDVQVQPVYSVADLDNFAGPGSELACMGYDALAVAGDQGVPVYICSPAAANGAVAATTVVKFAGGSTGNGQATIRIGGYLASANIPPGMTAAQAATLLASVVNGLYSGRGAVSASAAGAYLTLTYKTPGVRGNEQLIFLDASGMPPGMTATLYTPWGATIAYAVGDQVIPNPTDGLYFRCTIAGTSAGSQPTWPTTQGQTVTDGSVTWVCAGVTGSGTSPTTSVFLGGGGGLESYTNVLSTIQPTTYDRIAPAANDAVSLAAWKAQIDTVAGAPNNNLQQAVFAFNGSFAAAQSLAQTTVNDARFQCLWQQNGETHPSRLAAQWAGIRAYNEQGNPNSSYDGYVLNKTAPQSQSIDWPSLTVLIAAINNSLTPVTSGNFGLGPGGDGLSRVVRSITTKSLTNGSADYSSIDTGIPSTADFIFLDAKLYYLNVIQPANPVVSDNYPSNGPQVPSGVLTPDSAASTYNGRLVRFSQGVLSDAPQVGSASIPPIILTPQPGDVVAIYNTVSKRIDVTETVRVMPIDHQLGISVLAA